VRNVELASERMCDAVHQAESRVGEPDTGNVAGEQQFGASFDVRAIRHRSGQKRRNGRDHLEGNTVAVRVRSYRQVGLQRVRQGVHARRGSGARGQSDGEVGIEDRCAGQGAVVTDIELAVALHIGDHSKGIHLRASAGGRGDGDYRERRVGEGTRVVEPDSALGIHRPERYSLCGIHRRATADGCSEVASLVDTGGRRIRSHSPVDTHGEASPFERGTDEGDYRGSRKERIGDDKYCRCPGRCRDRAHLRDSSAPEVRDRLRIESEVDIVERPRKWCESGDSEVAHTGTFSSRRSTPMRSS
jgi:hypothetical protein